MPTRLKKLPFIYRHCVTSRIVVCLLWCLLVIVAARLVYLNQRDIKLNQFKTKEFAQLNLVASLWSSEMGHIRYLVKLIASDPGIRNAMNPKQALNTKDITEHFHHIAQVSPNIAQLRWLDLRGNERIRVNQSPTGLIKVVSAADLQNKSHRDYFQRAIKLAPGEIYISSIDPNVEHGKIEHPIQLMLRTILRTGAANGMRPGMLIINYRLNHLFNQLRAENIKPIHTELISPQGLWLLNPDKSLEMAAFKNKHQYNVANVYPELWHALIKNNWAVYPLLEGVFNNRLIAALRISYGSASSTSKFIYPLSSTAAGFYPDLINDLLWQVIVPATVIALLGMFIVLKMMQGGLIRHQLARQLFNEKTELTRVNERLYHTNQRLGQMQEANVELRKLSSLGMIVAGVAHELNTPIGGASVLVSSMTNQLNLLQQAVIRGLRRTELDDFINKQSEAVGLAKTNLVTAKNLITSFKRLAMERHQTDLSRFDLSDVVRDLEKTSQTRLRHSLIDISVSVPEHVYIQSYAGIISQVLQNLVDNALSHAFDENEAGQITITVTEDKAAHNVIIEVHDNGKGIDESLRGRMFEPFATSKPGSGHTGLGMHLVHNWIHQILRGSIEVASKTNKGTQTKITLPLKIEAVDASAQSRDGDD